VLFHHHTFTRFRTRMFIVTSPRGSPRRSLCHDAPPGGFIVTARGDSNSLNAGKGVCRTQKSYLPLTVRNGGSFLRAGAGSCVALMQARPLTRGCQFWPGLRHIYRRKRALVCVLA